MEVELKRRPNYVVGIFLVAYLVYSISYCLGHFDDNMAGCISLIVACILIFVYFLGFRDYKYTVTKKTVYTHRRLLKDKELDLMRCSTITDPVVSLTRWTSMPHAVEIYTDNNKRYSFFPADRVEFTGAVLRENKRIHCTVKEYTDLHRKLAKRQRKERRRAERERANKEN